MAIQAKQALTTIAKVAVAVGLVAWIVAKGAIDFSALGALVNPFSVTAALGLTFGLIFINNYRWLILMRARGLSATIGRTFPLSLIGIFFNYAMPGGVGGDVVKGFYLVKDHPEQKMTAVVSMVLDRLIGFFTMIAMATIAMALSWSSIDHSPQMKAMGIFLVVLFFAFSFGFLLALSSALQKFPFEKIPGGKLFKQVYSSLNSYRESPGAVALAVLVSFASQSMMIIFVYVVGQTMGFGEIPFSIYCFLVPIGLVATAIPVSPAGIGVGQAAFYFLFNLYLGRQSQLGPTAVTAMQIAQFAWGLIGAYFYLRRGKASPTEPQFG